MTHSRFTLSSHLCSALLLATSLAACSDASSSSSAPQSVGIGQGGAQDFGQFRAILAAGGIPGPDTLDDVGFFNEHKIELPPADCGQDVCLHGQLGVMGNMITGSNCTLVLLGMNSPLQPTAEDRPPLNLAVAIDTSGSMTGPNIEYVREGLLRMLDQVRPEDTLTLVAFSDKATTLLEAEPGGSLAIAEAISQLQAGGGTNIYAGLRSAFETVQAHADETHQNRVILLSDGLATEGIQNEARMIELAKGYGSLGFGLTTIGMGTEFNPTLMRVLSESGAGAFYFLEDPRAVQEVFEEEVKSFLVPVAQELEIDIDIDSDYSLRAIYGSSQVESSGNHGSVFIPSVQLAGRIDAEDQASGRRGGGGAMLVELVPRADRLGSTRGSIGTLSMSYRVAGGEEVMNQEVHIQSQLEVGETPELGAFGGDAVEKGFVMLNIFAGFELAAQRAAYGDYRSALGVLAPLAEQVEVWLLRNEDEDIQDDLDLTYMFYDNLVEHGGMEPPEQWPVPDPWPRD